MKIIDIVTKCMDENKSMSYLRLKEHPDMNRGVTFDER